MPPAVSQRVTIWARMASMCARGPATRTGVCAVTRRFRGESGLMRQPCGVLMISTIDTPWWLISLSTSAAGRVPRSQSPNWVNFLPATPLEVWPLACMKKASAELSWLTASTARPVSRSV